MENSRLVFIVTGVGILLLIFVIVMSSILLKKVSQSKTPQNPLPTFSPSGNIPTSLPDTILPTFTGARDVTFPPPTVALVNQKEDLRNKVPLSQPEFSINFDYASDQFVVQLKGDHDAAIKAFQDWLQQNYPNIPQDRFIIQ